MRWEINVKALRKLVDEVGTRDDPRAQGPTMQEGIPEEDRAAVINSPVDLSFSRQIAGISLNAPLPEDIGPAPPKPQRNPFERICAVAPHKKQRMQRYMKDDESYTKLASSIPAEAGEYWT